jgi:hypothetical protein
MLAAAGIKPNERIPVAEFAEPLDVEAKFLQALDLSRKVFEMWRMGYSGRHTERSAMTSLKAIFLAAVVLFSTAFPAYANAPSAPHFHTEQQAQQHCPNDTVVWVNTKTGVYHLKGERWYGATKAGAYVCRKEADAEGDRMTRNGQ